MRAEINKKIKGKTILITGGTGSFGHQVTETLLALNPKKIIIFSRDEKKQFDMRNEFDNPILKFIIGDVRDFDQINKSLVGVDYVFHAAALKQVPTCEFFPMEAVKTNILGTQNVVKAAIENNVKNVVALSTDKAVYPINVIGMSKAMMEKIIIAEAKNLIESKNKNTVLCSVRYGNVLYTRGSVVPYFVKHIKEGKKLPVTNFNMTRFLLPLPDAVDLVLYALINGENGYTYVRKSPACTLETLAISLCEIFDHKKGYYEVGIRAGEKMHETLVTQEELIRAKEESLYYKIPPESQGLDYGKYFYQGKKADVNKIYAFNSENTKRLDTTQTTKLLKSLKGIKKALKSHQIKNDLMAYFM